jgi:hypothetical protein
VEAKMYILNPNNASPSGKIFGSGDYSYKYPLSMKLKPGSPQHDKIRNAILERAQKSRSAISNRFDVWNKLDETMTAYIPLDEKEQALVSKDRRRPVSTVVPVSYATVETLLTYLVASFLQSPIFKFEGVGPEDIIGAKLLELVVDLQCQRFKAGLQIHTMFRDSLMYGFGSASPIWRRHVGYKTRKEEQGFFSAISSAFIRTETRKIREEVVLFEGNDLTNIDPYMTLPDPNYSIHDVQKAGFFGWVRRENLMDLLERETYDENFFNAKFIEQTGMTSTLGEDNSKRDKDSIRDHNIYGDARDAVDVIYMYTKIIPKQWDLGNFDVPERWLFALAGDSVVIAAGPTGLDHNYTPVGVCAPEYDGYSTLPIARLEIVQGMQRFADFLFNSHMTNVRKSINNMFVVDPELVNMNDLRSPSAGKFIRLRREAWGRGVENAIKQLDVDDITRNNMVDVMTVSGIVDRMLGTPNSLQGVLTPANERSATEFHETRSSALSRLEKVARIASLQAMQDLGYMIASQTQQFMTQEQYVKMAGDTPAELAAILDPQGIGRVAAGPLDILVDYDIMVNDGSLPTSGDPNQWAAMFQVIAANPTLAMKFDTVRIFQYWATLTGAKNIGDFVQKGGSVNAQVLPDEEVARQVEAGNIVPLGGAQGELQG